MLCDAVCGDGRRNDIERCDDGNLRNGDGCNSSCMVEQGWTCLNGTSARPSTCSRSTPDVVRI